MSKQCQICGKKPSRGRRLLYRGLPKRKGGIGLKITGNAKRWFTPNVQKVKVIKDGTVRRMRVCTACIRSGRIAKAPVRPTTRIAREARVAERLQAKTSAEALAASRETAASAAVEAERVRLEEEAQEAEAAEQARERRYFDQQDQEDMLFDDLE